MLARLGRLGRGRLARRALEALLLLALYFGLRAWLQQDMAAGTAPPLAGITLAGEPFDLQTFPERPVLIHFWATWCRICRMEQESIDAIARDWPVITVAMQSGDDAAVRAFLEREGLSFPVINDPEGALAHRYGVTGVPASFIVDRANRIVFRERGYTTGAGLRARLRLAR